MLDYYFGWSLCAEILTGKMLLDSAAWSIILELGLYFAGSGWQEGWVSAAYDWSERPSADDTHRYSDKSRRQPSQRFIGFLDNAVVVWVLCRIRCFLWDVERRKGTGERHGKTLNPRCVREPRTRRYTAECTQAAADCTAARIPPYAGSVYLSYNLVLLSMVVLASIDPDMKNLVDQVILIQKTNFLSRKYGIFCLQKSEFVIPKIRDSRFVNPGITGLKKVPGLHSLCGIEKLQAPMPLC